jgi:glycosyltransferase involved in cell wall biosynthesis
MDITIIVATHERFDALSKMIQSFRIYYPQIPIVAVDSSVEANPIQDITYIHVPSDTGISQQRNIALKQVTTPYFLLVDDDFVCNEHTDII